LLLVVLLGIALVASAQRTQDPITLVPPVVRTHVFKTVISSARFVTASTDADVTVFTIPAKAFVQHVLVDLTQTFACTDTCTTSTLSAYVGKTAGGNQYVLSFDADASVGQFGDAAAELGASLAPATAPTLIGDLGSWTAATTMSVRLHSGTGNIGTGTATHLSQGSMTVFVTYVLMP
jgi:hypothetical protein